MKKETIRVVIELKVDREACEEHKIDPQDVLKEINVLSDEIADGFFLGMVRADIDTTLDVLISDAKIITKEFVEETL